MSEISYTLVRSAKRKRLQISVSASDGIIVRAPNGVKIAEVEKLLINHQSWIEAQIAKVSTYTEVYQPKTLQEKRAAMHQAKSLIWSRLKELGCQHSFNFNKVFIKDLKSRWGSCSGLRNLNFNYRLVYLPVEILEYVVAHEICHLHEMNHGCNFWRLVERICPDYRKARQALKKYHLT